jgi:hypothetical protein
MKTPSQGGSRFRHHRPSPLIARRLRLVCTHSRLPSSFVDDVRTRSLLVYIW